MAVVEKTRLAKQYGRCCGNISEPQQVVRLWEMEAETRQVGERTPVKNWHDASKEGNTGAYP